MQKEKLQNKLFVENDANVGLAHEIDWAQVKEDAIIEIGLLANQMEKATKGSNNAIFITLAALCFLVLDSM